MLALFLQFLCMVLCALALRIEPTTSDWDTAYRACQDQNYMMIPGRSFRAKGLRKILQDGQSVWINGWRSVAQLKPDANGRIETFKLDFSRPLKKAMFAVCQDGASGSYIVSSSKTLAEQSEAQCYGEAYMPATVNTVWEYLILKEAIKSTSPHWLSDVNPSRGGKQCLRGEKTGGDIVYTYDDCDKQLNYICLDDESLIASFLPLIVLKDTEYSEVAGLIDEVKAMEKPSSSSARVPETSSSEFFETSSLFVPSSDIMPSSSSVKPMPSEAIIPSTSVMIDAEVSTSSVPPIAPDSTSSAIVASVTSSETTIAPTSSKYAMETSMYVPDVSSPMESSSSSIVPSSSSSSLYVVDVLPSESSSSETYIISSTPSSYVPQISVGSSDILESSYTIDVEPMTSTPLESSTKRAQILVDKSDMPPEFLPTPSSSDAFLPSSPIYYKPITEDNMYTSEETTSETVTIIESTDMTETDTYATSDYADYETTTEDTVDVSMDKGLDITTAAEETNESNDPHSKQSTATAGMDTSLIVAFVLLVIAVFVCILIAIVLYRRRKMQKSKDITTTAENGKAVPPAPAVTPLPTEDTPVTEVELRDKRSTSKERDSATYRDTAYDL